MSLRDKFTLIITVHGRKQHINSMIKYYSDLDCDIVILDSSKQRTHIDNIDRVDYVFEPDKPYYNKLYDKLSSITTPYVLELPDDDIAFKQAIIDCVNYLDENKDCSFVDGLYLNGSSGVGVDGLYYESPVYQGTTTYYLNNELREDDSAKRVKTLISEFYKANNHSIIRTEVLKTIHKFSIDNIELQPVEYFDRLWAFIAGCYGNYRVLEIPYMIRRTDDKIIRTSTDYPVELKRGVSFWTITDGDKLNHLAEFFSKISGYDIDTSIEITYFCFKNIKIERGYTHPNTNIPQIIASKKDYYKELNIQRL